MYMSDEEVIEMVIYPSMNKYKHQEIYSWLHNKFIEELKNSIICIVIGYSFRDQDISDTVIEFIKNCKIFLVIISPRSTNTKRKLIEQYNLINDRKTRIISINKSVEIIKSRDLNNIIPKLYGTIKNEEEVFKKQNSKKEIIDDWKSVFDFYKEIGHNERI